MMGSVSTVSILCLLSLTATAEPTVAEVCVLDGPEVQHMRDGLERVGCAFRRAAKLDKQALSRCRVLVLSGKEPPWEARYANIVEQFAQSGGSVLAVGGGAAWMLQHKLFDAQGYYPAGTTIHMSTFHGYHRLTFGYPGAEPAEGWTAGVPMLLRATEGPLMELGPRATSILGCGGPFSAAAFQRIGKGLVLLIGPDPQGGNAYHSLDKPTPTPGDKLDTDRVLESAIAFLENPSCNLVPNNGFEQHTDLPPVKSNWQITLRGGATSEWCHDDAPEGSVFLRLACSERAESASVEPYCPLVVERGARYRVGCLYKSSIPWTLGFRPFTGAPGSLKQQTAPPLSVTASDDWKELEAEWLIPDDVSYVKPIPAIRGAGELCLGRLTVEHLPE